MTDPYKTLGVDRAASDADIRKAFKALTRKHHPDLHPGDAAAAERFSEISTAYDLLKDPETRARFDAGEIGASGVERPQQRYYRDFADAGAAGGHAARDGFASDEDLEEFLSRAFGARGRSAGGGAGGASFRARGQDVSYAMPVDFLIAAAGGAREIRLPDGKGLKVRIPAGAHDRQMLRLKGQGMPGFGGGPPGDAYVELHVEPHAFFRRKDENIHLDVPVTLREAVLGGRIEVPTIDGPARVTVPPGSNTGTTLRLRGKGVLDPKSGERGHQFITLSVVLPRAGDPELATFLRDRALGPQDDPRKEMLS
jgi:DnaJ-class molecular chaperone